MKSKRTALIIFLVLLVAAIWQAFHFVPQLPKDVITQQDMYGDPYTVLPAVAVVGIYIVVLVGCTLYFLGFTWALPKLPGRFFKILPNHDFWFNADNHAGSMNFLAVSLLWLGNATLAMFLATFFFIFTYNTQAVFSFFGTPINIADIQVGAASTMVSTLYLTYVFIALLKIKNRFKRLPADATKTDTSTPENAESSDE